MVQYLCLLAAVCVAVGGAPPPNPRIYQQTQRLLQQVQERPPLNVQQMQSTLDTYLDNAQLAAIYDPHFLRRNQLREQEYQRQELLEKRKQQQANRAAGHLENLEPDSEVELIPGAQQPQPPQQTPPSPTIPGLVPGQRVYIVHMPIPGYIPGTVGGYHPLYIVAAATPGDATQAPNGIPGYQAAIPLNPPGQNPLFFAHMVAPNMVVGNAPIPFRGNEEVYRHLVEPYYAYSGAPAPQFNGPRGSIRLTQMFGIPGKDVIRAPDCSEVTTCSEGPQATDGPGTSGPKRVGEADENSETKEELTEKPRDNARPQSTHRPKA